MILRSYRPGYCCHVPQLTNPGSSCALQVLGNCALSTQSAETDRQSRGFQANSEPRDCCLLSVVSQSKKGFPQAYLVPILLHHLVLINPITHALYSYSCTYYVILLIGSLLLLPYDYRDALRALVQYVRQYILRVFEYEGARARPTRTWLMQPHHKPRPSQPHGQWAAGS